MALNETLVTNLDKEMAELASLYLGSSTWDTSVQVKFWQIVPHSIQAGELVGRVLVLSKH